MKENFDEEQKALLKLYELSKNWGGKNERFIKVYKTGKYGLIILPQQIIGFGFYKYVKGIGKCMEYGVDINEIKHRLARRRKWEGK